MNGSELNSTVKEVSATNFKLKLASPSERRSRWAGPQAGQAAQAQAAPEVRGSRFVFLGFFFVFFEKNWVLIELQK